MLTGTSDINGAWPDGRSDGVIPGLVWAFRFHADGTPESLPVDRPIPTMHDGWLWLHFSLADGRALEWLAGVDMPKPAVDLLLSKDNFQQVHIQDGTVYGVFSDLIRDIESPTDDIGFLRFVMTERALISARQQALSATDATRRLLEGGRRIDRVAGLLERIVEEVADTMDRAADRIGTELDGIEERIVDGYSSGLRTRLARLRRLCVRLHRQLAGLRVLFHRLERKSVDDLTPAMRLHAARLAQRLDGLDHDIIELRERSRLLEEELHFRTEEESNRHLYVLSILTTLLLPPTLVTGIFGMNTKGLPLTESESGFVIAILLILGSSALAYWIMRRLGVVK